jgi:acyl-CoA synthetase (AMP-forming)/AMP-acid ligase II
MRYTCSFIDRLAAQPSRPLLWSADTVTKAGDLLTQSTKLAAMLERHGLGDGDVAVVLAEGGPAFLYIVYATMMTGLKLALIDPEMGPDNYQAKLAQLKPAVVFVDSRLLLLQEHPLVYGPARRLFHAPYIPWFNGSLLVSIGSWMPLVRRHERLGRWLKHAPPFATSELPARSGEYLITYTSGTLAEPKGVVHSFAGLEESVQHVARMLGDPERLRIATHLPHYMMLSLSMGMPVFAWKQKWPAAKKLRFIEQNGITNLFGPPSDYVPMIAALEKEGRRFPDSLRWILLGAAPVYPSFLRRLRNVLPPHTRVVCIYGMTENLVVATAELDEKLDFAEPGDLLGRPVDGVEVRIADDGELLLRSGQCYTRYFHESERPPWHATGDLARLRSDGSIVLLGRKKDMIIRGNFNLYPALYEPTINRMPGIDAAVLLGIYDETRADEVVYLVVEPAEDDPSRKDLVRQQIAAALREGPFAIDRQALPDEIRLMKLPRSGRSQKVDRNILRQRLGASP